MDVIYFVDGDRVETTANAGGPWDPTMQHGGAPSSLAVWAAEQIASAVPMRVARLTIDLLRPVPVAPLRLRTEVLREGRKIQVVQVSLMSEDKEVARAEVLKVRRIELDLPPAALPGPLMTPGPLAGQRQSLGARNAFGSGVDVSAIDGSFQGGGPGKVWFRLHRPVVAGHANSPAMRAAATGDFCNGVSSVLDFTKWTYLNGDLTVSLARDPVGEWILLDAETLLGPDGCAVASGKLADEQGYFGRATQTLVIEPR